MYPRVAQRRLDVETSIPLPLGEDDLERAIRELVLFGGRLTQSLLGYRPAFGFFSHAGPTEQNEE